MTEELTNQTGMKLKNVNRGQTIVEAIVVIGVVVILVTGLVAGTTSSLRSAQLGKTRSQALKYAEESLEFVRNIRDQRWDTLQSYNGWYCLGSDMLFVSIATDTCTTNIVNEDGSYTRTLRFTWDGVKMNVQASVRYPDGGSTKEVSLTTHYTQWK
jgi:type II secretory pathway pseudopilin PulG